MGDKLLDGRRIVVTGAASGMGRAIATLFASQGARQLLLDIDEQGLDTLDLPGITRAVVDVGSDTQIDEAIARGASAMDGINGVLNVAGIVRFQPFGETTFDDFYRIVNVNLFGPFRISRAALPHLQAAKSGTIVNITSIASVTAEPGCSAYSASKAGLAAMTRVLAAELAPSIRVNAIAPGMIDTPMLKAATPDIPDVEAQFKDDIALKRAGRPTEIAEAALFLSSDRSSFITGTTLTVDGGNTWR